MNVEMNQQNGLGGVPHAIVGIVFLNKKLQKPKQQLQSQKKKLHHKGSLTLLGGEPGIGKSTLILQICNKIAKDGQVLYVSGEESAEQIKLRADRLGINNDNILFLGETDIDIINQSIIELNPKLVIIDSIQTMYSEDITAAARKCKPGKGDYLTNNESM